MIKFSFNKEKVSGQGEDSDPILLALPSMKVVGVFDGMGGSGAAQCQSDFGEHSKAYVASRIIREAVETYLKKQKDGVDINPIKLAEVCTRRLDDEKTKYPAEKSVLKGSIMRDYPTTLAIICASQNSDKITLNSYWAGDSRNYMWTRNGFFQISKDDLKGEYDPLENLRNDAALSNCICGDRIFSINQISIEIERKPCVVFSVTDGCFGYFKSPMHFAEMLRDTLLSSKDDQDWKKRIEARIDQVTGDDASLSLMVLGTEDFDELKDCLRKQIYNLDKIDRQENEIQQLKEQKQCIENYLIYAEKKLLAEIDNAWESYKSKYCHYLTAPEQVEPSVNEKTTPEPLENDSGVDLKTTDININAKSSENCKKKTNKGFKEAIISVKKILHLIILWLKEKL